MATTPPRRLEKSRTQRIMFGVTGGVAEYLAIDVVLVRVAFVALAFLSGVGIVAYIALAIFMPEPPDQATTPPGERAAGASTPAPPPPPPATAESAVRGRYVVGAVLIGAGTIFLLQELHLMPFPGFWGWDGLIPLALIAIGLALVISKVRR